MRYSRTHTADLLFYNESFIRRLAGDVCEPYDFQLSLRRSVISWLSVTMSLYLDPAIGYHLSLSRTTEVQRLGMTEPLTLDS